MVIRITASQIPTLWEAIKFTAARSDRIPEKDLPLYLNRLLIALLNDKAQCFIRMDENKELLAIAITRIIQDEVTGEKTLFWNHLYSFKLVSNDQWEDDWPVIQEFAKLQGCKKITLYTTNHRVVELATSRGFVERYKCLVLEVV